MFVTNDNAIPKLEINVAARLILLVRQVLQRRTSRQPVIIAAGVGVCGGSAGRAATGTVHAKKRTIKVEQATIPTWLGAGVQVVAFVPVAGPVPVSAMAHACMHACMHASIHPFIHTYIHAHVHTTFEHILAHKLTY